MKVDRQIWKRVELSKCSHPNHPTRNVARTPLSIVVLLGLVATLNACGGGVGTTSPTSPALTSGSNNNGTSGNGAASSSGGGNGGAPGSGGSAQSGCGSSIAWGGSSSKGSGGSPRFTVTSLMTQPRAGHTATLLANGKVLIVDGGQLDIDDLLVSISYGEVYDPATGQFTLTGSSCVPREFHTATLLGSGKVLITGGNEFYGYPTSLAPSTSAELYDPASGTSTRTGNMTFGRSYHTATLLADGRVLIAGGQTLNGSGATTTYPALASAEIYDPVAGTFSAAGSMAVARSGHTATLLPSGKVLIAGGQSDQGALASAELYDPQTNSFSALPAMTAARVSHTATLLATGKVLIAGGAADKDLFPGVLGDVPQQTSTELFDPFTGNFTAAASMSTGRVGHTATLLGDGTVLVAGGYKVYIGAPNWLGYQSYDTAEIYDPVGDRFTSVGPMNSARFWHTATRLLDGSVLFTGGITADNVQAAAEIFK